MIKKENGSTQNKARKTKKIIKLIIYIILLGFLAFISVKSCNITLKALEPTAQNWNTLNNRIIKTSYFQKFTTEQLGNNSIIIMNNRNTSTGQLSDSGSWYISAENSNLQYDEIRISTYFIQLRKYTYEGYPEGEPFYNYINVWQMSGTVNTTNIKFSFKNINNDRATEGLGAHYEGNLENASAFFLSFLNQYMIYEDDNYESGYNQGWQNGYQVGYDEGNQDGYQDGYQDGRDYEYPLAYDEGYQVGFTYGEQSGYDEGYQVGYEAGVNGSLNTSWILSIMNTATRILQIEIFPNIKLIYLVGGFIILAFVRFVISWVK